MTPEEELERFRLMVIELNNLFPLAYIGQEIGVSERQVANYKAGEDRPKGFVAIRLYLFHTKHKQAA